MMEIEHAVRSGAIVGRAALRPGQASRLALRLAALGLAISLAARMAVAQTTPDADQPAATASRPMDAEGEGSQPASHSDGAGALGEEPKSPKRDSPAADTGLLVAEGESVPDIDKIIEALDRRAPVSAVAFSPDGALIASGSEDHMVRVWHLTTGRLLRRLEGHSSAVTAVAFSPDGSTIASASNDRTARLWDARSGRLLRTLQGHVYHVYTVAFDPKGRWLATASWDRTIQLWDAKSGLLLKKLRGHGAAIRSIDFSHDGKLLASGSDDQTIRLWNVNTGKELKILSGHTGSVSAVRFRPDGEWLFSGSTDQTVRMWRLSDGMVLRKLDDCGGPVLALAESPNGQILGGACGVGGSVLWDVPTGAQLRRRGGHGTVTRAIAFSFDGRMVASGSEDASIVVEDVATGRALASLSANVAHLEAVAFSPDGKTLATVSRDRRVLVWQDAGEHKSLSRVLVGAQGALRTLVFSPDGKAIVAGGDDRTLAFWDLEGDGPSYKLTSHEAAINAVAFTPDGRSIVSAGDDATVRVWDLKKGAEVRVMKAHRAPVRAVALSPDGKVLASASDDETVRVWETATGRGLGVLKSHRAPVTSVAFSPDGKYLITGSQDRTIDVWLHAKSKLLKGQHKELASGVVALAVAARGDRIVSASSDGMLTLWELAGSRPLQQASAHADVSALAFAPDGVTVASASRDGVLRLWDSKTLARRWSLAGSTRERWFACNDAETCWRNEDGALLGRVNGQGDIVPVPPADNAHRTVLAVVVDWKNLGGGIDLMEGKTVSIPIRIENRGAHPAYWVNVAQSVVRTPSSKASLLLIQPPTITALAPAARMKVVCEVSALGEYENPEPHSEMLRLSITSASAQTLSLEIPMRVETPHLKLRELAISPGAGNAVVAWLSDVAMAQLQPVILQGKLTLEGDEPASIAPITLEQALNGQDLALAFPLPEGMRLNRKTQATLTVRKSTHPAHVWTFAHWAVHIPIPLWFWELLVAGVLGLGLVIRRTGLQVWARAFGRTGKRFARLLLAVLLGLAKTFLALLFLRSTLRSLRARVQRSVIAVMFFRLQPETQCSHLARQLGARWRPLAGGREPVFELHLGPEVPLDVERCLLALPMPGDALAAALAHLDAIDEGQDAITVVLSNVPRPELVERLHAPRRLVVFSKAAMNRVLRAPRPALVFAQVVSDQVGRAPLSLYRSAVSGGQRQPFYGRKGELRRLTVDPRGNHLIIGPYGIGKTSLLDEIYRRLHTHPTIQCHYLSLTDGDLTTALADELGVPGQPSLETLLLRLSDLPKGKKAVVLCDDADAWATRDAAQGGRELEALAGLDREDRCCFVLAGFLGLLHAAWPEPGRKPFGDVIRLECLDDEACFELATEPMAALNAHYAHAALVELIAQQSGGMPSLLVAICNQIVDLLDPDQRTIDRALVESACKSEAVARAITAWRPRFGLQEPQLLDQTVMLAAVFKVRFTLQELQSTLASLGVQATATEIEHSARRLVAACVFEQWLGHFHFRVPLFQRVMQEAALARVIAP
jgi:WD40 repeat protein